MQPSNQTAIVGGTVAFAVTAIGTTPYFYQWTSRDKHFRCDKHFADAGQCATYQRGCLFRHGDKLIRLGDKLQCRADGAGGAAL